MTIVTRGIAAAAIATLIFALGIATSARAAPSVPIQQPDTIVIQIRHGLVLVCIALAVDASPRLRAAKSVEVSSAIGERGHGSDGRRGQVG
jgi:hypothetical protein